MRQYSKHLLFAFRVMSKTPIVTALTITVLSIAIAQVSLMFNMIESVLFNKLPWEGSERLVRISRENPENRFANSNFPHATYHELLKHEKVFEGVIAVFSDNMILQNGEKSDQIMGNYISAEFMDLLGVEPIMGRTMTAEDADPSAPPVIIISYETWMDYFVGDPEILGKSVSVDGTFRTIIGVAPKDFAFPFLERAWVPLNTDTVTEYVGWGDTVFVVGKIKEGLSADTALAQLNDIFPKIKTVLPVENENFTGFEFTHFKELWVNDQTRVLFFAMGVCAVLVLFMACAIVSNLMTVRSAKRSNELAIRSALGASRPQLIMQMLFESLVTSVISLILGWLLMRWFNYEILQGFYDRFTVPSWFFNDEYSFRHFLFVMIIPIIVTIASTLIPAIRASRTSLNDLLKESTRTGSSLKMTILGKILIIFQIAAACAVVTGGAIVGYYLHDINAQEQHYDPNEFLYAQIGMGAGMFETDQARANQLKNVLKELESYPEVEGAVYSTELFTGPIIVPLEIVGEEYATPDDYPQFYRWVVSPGYFELMGAPLIAGREFTELDDKDHPYATIVTNVFAEQVFGDENPIGKQMIYRDGENEWTLNIVGISKDIFKSERDQDNRTGFFLNAYQDIWFDFGIHMKIPNGNPKAFEPKLIRTVSDLDSRFVISNVQTFNERVESFQIGVKFIFTLFMTFSVGALIMAAAGLYGVVSFSVSERIREIGIRLALGASPINVIGRVFRQGLLNVTIGVVFGVLAAFLIRHLLMIILQPFFESMVVYMGVLLLILIISSFAILIPAVRGGNTDPAEALRID